LKERLVSFSRRFKAINADYNREVVNSFVVLFYGHLCFVFFGICWPTGRLYRRAAEKNFIIKNHLNLSEIYSTQSTTAQSPD